MHNDFVSKRHQGSRGHLLDLLDRDGWREELNQLISTAGAFIGPDSIHVPVDTASPAEWSLARFCKTHCTADMDAGRFDGWWVKAGSPPTWDLIATCAIDGRPGLLIVEAKAHEGEIHRDGKLHPLEGLKGTPDERLLGDVAVEFGTKAILDRRQHDPVDHAANDFHGLGPGLRVVKCFFEARHLSRPPRAPTFDRASG